MLLLNMYKGRVFHELTVIRQFSCSPSPLTFNMIVLPEPLGGSMSPTLIVALSVLSLLYFVFRLFRQRSKSPELPIFGDTKQNLLWDALMQGGKEVLLPCLSGRRCELTYARHEESRS